MVDGFTTPYVAPTPVSRSRSSPSRSSTPGACAATSPAPKVSSAPSAATAPGRRARAVPASGRVADARARVVGAEDGPEVVPRARAADGAPLAHADAVAVAAPLERRHRRALAARGRWPAHGKIGAVQRPATAHPQHRADVVSAHVEGAARRAHHQLAH